MIPVQSYRSGRHFIEIKRTTLLPATSSTLFAFRWKRRDGIGAVRGTDSPNGLAAGARGAALRLKLLVVLVEGHMHRRNVLTLAGLFGCTCLVGLSGCASLARPLPERRPTQVYASFSKTWGAAVDYFERSGVSVDTADRSSGIIRADATTMPRDKSHFGLCGNSVLEPYWYEDRGFYWTRNYGERPLD